MKIENNVKTSPVNQAKRKGGASSTAVNFGSFMFDEDEATINQTNPPSTLNTFLSIEEVTQQQINNDARENGSQILEKLEQLRMGLLSGGISKQNLIQLEQLIKQEKLKVSDPRLKNILDEIEVRAAVELAKLLPR